jgi:hypothetical protein
MQWLGYLAGLPSELRIGQVHLVTSSAYTWIFPLRNVSGTRRAGGSYQMAAETGYEGEPLGISLDLLTVDKGLGVTAAEARIQLLDPVSTSEITLTGKLEGTRDDFRYNFALSAFYRDISDFLTGFKGGSDLALAGELRSQGTMTGDTDGFTLSDATFLLNNAPEYAFQASGSLTYMWSGETRIDMAALGEMASMAYLVNWIDLDVADFGRVHSEIKLGGSLDKPVIDQFRLTTSNDEGLQVSLSGRLNLFETDTVKGPGTNTVLLDLRGPSLGVLQRWLGEPPFEPGPWRVTGKLSGHLDNFVLQDINIATGERGSLEVRASGSIGQIRTPRAGHEQYTASGILLSVQAHTPDSAQLRALLGRDDIPPGQEVTASVELAGSTQELQLSSGAVTISASDLRATAGPLSALLRPGDETPLADLAGPVLIELRDASALSRYLFPRTSRPIPVPGDLKLTARLAQKDEIFQLLDLVGVISGDGVNSVTKGRIGNLATFGDISLDTRFTGLDTRTVLAATLPDFACKKPLGTMEGALKLVRQEEVWTISKLSLNGGTLETPVVFNLDGDVKDLSGLFTADIKADITVRDPELLQALSGLNLNSMSASLTVAATSGQVKSLFKAKFGETDISGNALIAMGDDGIQGINVSLETPRLHLPDFGLGEARDGAGTPAAQEQGRPVVRDPEAAGQTSDPVAQLRRKLPLYPVELDLTIDEFSGDASNFDSLRLRITGKDKRYTLAEFSARYGLALAELRGIIDLNPDPAVLSLAGQASTLPLSAIFADAGISSNVSGALTLLGGVTLMGEDPQTLIGNLNGSVALALEDAVIEGAAYDLLATDLLAWIYSGALNEKSTRLDCTMAKFQLRQGVATSDSLYIESSRMVATGSAKFDLPRQKMDLRITPLSKSRMLQVPSEVRLKGDMSDPKPEISPVSAVADATSAALMLIPNLTLKLFGVNNNAPGNARPCEARLSN